MESAGEFCGSLGGAGRSPCLDGGGAAFNSTRPAALPLRSMFLERVGNGSYLNMAAHPDGSARVFLSTQAGKVFLATVPPREICHYRTVCLHTHKKKQSPICTCAKRRMLVAVKACEIAEET
ncbi:HIPL1 protein [Zea mays]|uniref:HIPL1 protein n=1 Tax=Zea mays TaxID=4577 RepID=UPI00165213DB|nr:HIPL1 protein [Zea mays]